MNKQKKKNNIKIIHDHHITSDDIILINQERKFISRLNKTDAMSQASQQEKNLIQITCDKNGVATCVISDINKYKYEINKKQKKIVIKKTKEIRITSKSDLTDLLRNLDQCYTFIKDKNLSVTILLKSYRRSFHGKDEFIKNHIESQEKIIYSIQKSPKPNLLKLYLTKKSNKNVS